MSGERLRAAVRKRKNTARKGQQLVQMAAKILEARGAKVEVATNKLVWVYDKAKGIRVPRSMKHDFFGVFDLLALLPEGPRALYQVTTRNNLSGRRDKVLGAGEWTDQDAILCWIQGRGRHFLVVRGPTFDPMVGVTEEWYPVPAVKATIAPSGGAADNGVEPESVGAPR